MAEPVVPKTAPYLINETSGEKTWCACGRSKTQPFCDGSHVGTGVQPVTVVIEAPRKVAWCGCKHTGRPPFCDGSHAEMP